jgi:hypothetical protein
MGKLLIAYLNRRAAAYRRPFAAIDGPQLADCCTMAVKWPPEAGRDPVSSVMIGGFAALV